ncbi:hypothetical protein [Solirubrum puertoriconensis]|uniref:Uncharacterized protein n=1 Tax=Solirubrum puertoriconensis TaxID=1751427 RepID=A0A9X0L6P1_SOLP1|nr:hypothetical protein [Solirubrum puertoriconensis]KUG09961.1 hypothetical protein ASU33_20670 [Solirubrum puertoriconensis]
MKLTCYALLLAVLASVPAEAAVSETPDAAATPSAVLKADELGGGDKFKRKKRKKNRTAMRHRRHRMRMR